MKASSASGLWARVSSVGIIPPAESATLPYECVCGKASPQRPTSAKACLRQAGYGGQAQRTQRTTTGVCLETSLQQVPQLLSRQFSVAQDGDQEPGPNCLASVDRNNSGAAVRVSQVVVAAADANDLEAGPLKGPNKLPCFEGGAAGHRGGGRGATAPNA